MDGMRTIANAARGSECGGIIRRVKSAVRVLVTGLDFGINAKRLSFKDQAISFIHLGQGILPTTRAHQART